MKKYIVSLVLLCPIFSFALDCKKLTNEAEKGFELCLQKKQAEDRIACSDGLEKKMGSDLPLKCPQDMESLIGRVSAKEKKLYPSQKGIFSDEAESQELSAEEMEANKKLIQKSMGRVDPRSTKGKPNTDMPAKCAQYVVVWKKRAQACLKNMDAEMKLMMLGKVKVSCNDQVNTDFEKSPIAKMCPTMMSGILLREEK